MDQKERYWFVSNNKRHSLITEQNDNIQSTLNLTGENIYSNEKLNCTSCYYFRALTLAHYGLDESTHADSFSPENFKFYEMNTRKNVTTEMKFRVGVEKEFEAHKKEIIDKKLREENLLYPSREGAWDYLFILDFVFNYYGTTSRDPVPPGIAQLMADNYSHIYEGFLWFLMQSPQQYYNVLQIKYFKKAGKINLLRIIYYSALSKSESTLALDNAFLKHLYEHLSKFPAPKLSDLQDRFEKSRKFNSTSDENLKWLFNHFSSNIDYVFKHLHRAFFDFFFPKIRNLFVLNTAQGKEVHDYANRIKNNAGFTDKAVLEAHLDKVATRVMLRPWVSEEFMFKLSNPGLDNFFGIMSRYVNNAEDFEKLLKFGYDTRYNYWESQNKALIKKKSERAFPGGSQLFKQGFQYIKVISTYVGAVACLTEVVNNMQGINYMEYQLRALMATKQYMTLQIAINISNDTPLPPFMFLSPTPARDKAGEPLFITFPLQHEEKPRIEDHNRVIASLNEMNEYYLAQTVYVLGVFKPPLS